MRPAKGRRMDPKYKIDNNWKKTKAILSYPYCCKNDRRNSGGALRQKETKNALKTAKKKKEKKKKKK